MAPKAASRNVNSGPFSQAPTYRGTPDELNRALVRLTPIIDEYFRGQLADGVSEAIALQFSIQLLHMHLTRIFDTALH